MRSPHLVVKHEQIIIERQSDHPDRHVLRIILVLRPSSPVAAELTISTELMAKAIAYKSIFHDDRGQNYARYIADIHPELVLRRSEGGEGVEGEVIYRRSSTCSSRLSEINDSNEKRGRVPRLV